MMTLRLRLVYISLPVMVIGTGVWWASARRRREQERRRTLRRSIVTWSSLSRSWRGTGDWVTCHKYCPGDDMTWHDINPWPVTCLTATYTTCLSGIIKTIYCFDSEHQQKQNGLNAKSRKHFPKLFLLIYIVSCAVLRVTLHLLPLDPAGWVASRLHFTYLQTSVLWTRDNPGEWLEMILH